MRSHQFYEVTDGVVCHSNLTSGEFVLVTALFTYNWFVRRYLHVFV